MTKYRIRAYCVQWYQGYCIQRKGFWGWKTIRDAIHGHEKALEVLEEIKKCEAK
jgi:hypothetical protein